MYTFVSLLISDVMFLFSESTSCLFIIALDGSCCFLIRIFLSFPLLLLLRLLFGWSCYCSWCCQRFCIWCRFGFFCTVCNCLLYTDILVTFNVSCCSLSLSTCSLALMPFRLNLLPTSVLLKFLFLCISLAIWRFTHECTKWCVGLERNRWYIA